MREVDPRIGVWILVGVLLAIGTGYFLGMHRNHNQAKLIPEVTVIISTDTATSASQNQDRPPKLFFRGGFPTQGPETVVKLEIQEFKVASDSPSYEVAIYAQLRREATTSDQPVWPELSPKCGIEESILFTIKSCAAVLNYPEKDTPGIQYEEGWVLIDKCGVYEDCQWDVPVPFEKKTIREVRAYLVRQRYV